MPGTTLAPNYHRYAHHGIQTTRCACILTETLSLVCFIRHLTIGAKDRENGALAAAATDTAALTSSSHVGFVYLAAAGDSGTLAARCDRSSSRP